MKWWWVLGVVGCGRGVAPGLAPEAGLPRPPAVHTGGRFDGAALGWTLGGEVHLFVADDAFTATVYARVVRTGQGGAALPPGLDSAFRTRRLVTIAAERITGRPRGPGYFDATILHARGAVPATLELIRLHRPGDCSTPSGGAVTELVYSFPQAALPAAPPSHSVVAALFHAPAYVRSGAAGARLDRDAAARLAGRVAAAAEQLAARRGIRALAPEPFTRRLILDAETATDAADVVPLPPADSGGPTRYAVAVRARFRGPPPGSDTAFVSAVAVTDTNAARVQWVMRPVRAWYYVLRGAVVYPPPEGVHHLLLIDRIADVEAGHSRLLAVDPATRRVVAASPLALRCR